MEGHGFMAVVRREQPATGGPYSGSTPMLTNVIFDPFDLSTSMAVYFDDQATNVNLTPVTAETESLYTDR